MCLATPKSLSKGQRRTDYRISVTNVDKIVIEVLDTSPECSTACPLNCKVYKTTAINFSRGGLALLAEDDSKFIFRSNKKYFIQFRLPNCARELVFLIEVRHIAELFGGAARKLGCMFYRWPDVRVFREQMNELNKFLVSIERSKLKK